MINFTCYILSMIFVKACNIVSLEQNELDFTGKYSIRFVLVIENNSFLLGVKTYTKHRAIRCGV